MANSIKEFIKQKTKGTALYSILKSLWHSLKPWSSMRALKDFGEFSGIPLLKIKEHVKNFRALANKEWDAIPGQEFRYKAKEFYERSECYIYDLLSSNPGKEAVIHKWNCFNPSIPKLIKDHPGKKFLEFGGGIGLVCEIVHKFGKRVTYVDIPGKVSDFAKWRFQKYAIPAEIIIVDPAAPLKLNEDYDIIFTDAVLEHVVDPVQIVDQLSLRLKKDGLLFLLIDLGGENDEYHMHRDCNIFKIHEAVKKNGCENMSGENTFCSVWKK